LEEISTAQGTVQAQWKQIKALEERIKKLKRVFNEAKSKIAALEMCNFRLAQSRNEDNARLSQQVADLAGRLQNMELGPVAYSPSFYSYDNSSFPGNYLPDDSNSNEPSTYSQELSYGQNCETASSYESQSINNGL
ncbi:MAG: hypothetical protein V4487_07750, partial [Chlamydiota bacterium]